MTAINTESMAFRLQNMARAAMREHMPVDDRAKLAVLDRNTRFEVYRDLDSRIIEEATRLLREQGGDIETKFDQAAINVFEKV